MTARELTGDRCYSFEGVLDFSGEKLLERAVSLVEREDGRAEKALSYGLCGTTALYLFGSVIRALI